MIDIRTPNKIIKTINGRNTFLYFERITLLLKWIANISIEINTPVVEPVVKIVKINIIVTALNFFSINTFISKAIDKTKEYIGASAKIPVFLTKFIPRKTIGSCDWVYKWKYKGTLCIDPQITISCE
ncbi:hypothetical protein COSHB9_00530 [Companilactobacillus alimentarius]